MEKATEYKGLYWGHTLYCRVQSLESLFLLSLLRVEEEEDDDDELFDDGDVAGAD